MGKKRTNKPRQEDVFHPSDVIAASESTETEDVEVNVGAILLEIVKSADVERLRTVQEAASPADNLLMIMNWMHRWQQEYQCIMASLTQYMAALNSNLEDNEDLEDNAQEMHEMETEAEQVISGFETLALKLIENEQSIDVNVLDEMGWTLLMQAANCGSVSFVETLVKQHQADISKRQHNDAMGMHALARAVDAGHAAVLPLLLSEDLANSFFHFKNEDDVEGELEVHSALTLACRGGHEEVVAFLLTQSSVDVNLPLPDSNDTALHIATCFDMETVVLQLLQHAATNVNAVNAQGYTAAFGCSNAELVQTLLAHGLDAMLEGFQGETLLDMALALGDEDVAEVVQAHLEGDDDNDDENQEEQEE